MIKDLIKERNYDIRNLSASQGCIKKFGITDYTVIDHPAAHTTEEADAYIAGHEGVRTKTMFLKWKKKNFYMVIMDDKKPMDFHEFMALTGAKRVSMARNICKNNLA